MRTFVRVGGLRLESVAGDNVFSHLGPAVRLEQLPR
jgi:hypothetical protein